MQLPRHKPSDQVTHLGEKSRSTMKDKTDYGSLVMQELGANIVNSLSPHIAIFDENGKVLAINKAWREFAKLDPPPPHNLIEGENYLEACQQKIPEANPEAEAFCQAFHALCNNVLIEFSLEFSSNLPTGTRWFLGKMTSFPRMNRKYIVISHEDITELKQAQFEIHHLAYYDSLTGLPNRLLFLDRLEQALNKAKRGGKIVALLFLDLDRFKIINDTLGHTAGDQLLQTVAQRLKSLVRGSDTVARMGGDEFMILLPDLDGPNGAAIITRKLLKILPMKTIIQEQDIFPSASVGIALYPNDALDGDSLITFADMAMYHSKEKGRNNFQFFSKELNQKTMERMKLESEIRRGIHEKEFVLFYQPYYEIESKKLCGVKGLLRWNHPVKGIIPASDILPLLEESGSWVFLVEWALKEACCQVKSWENEGWKAPLLSMNLTKKQLQSPKTHATVSQILAETGLAPSSLELEIDEQVFLTYLEDTFQILYQLKDLGVKIAVNNFGLTYSSLRYIKRLGIDRLKIEPSLIRNIPDNQEDAAITEAIINMGNTLKIKVLGKGVEKSSQVDFLRKHKCDEIQGFLFDYPAPGDQVFEKMSAHFK